MNGRKILKQSLADYALVDSLANKQPMLVVKLDNELHKISITTIRKLANGERYSGNRDKLIQILATALKHELD